MERHLGPPGWSPRLRPAWHPRAQKDPPKDFRYASLYGGGVFDSVAWTQNPRAVEFEIYAFSEAVVWGVVFLLVSLLSYVMMFQTHDAWNQFPQIMKSDLANCFAEKVLQCMCSSVGLWGLISVSMLTEMFNHRILLWVYYVTPFWNPNLQMHALMSRVPLITNQNHKHRLKPNPLSCLGLLLVVFFCCDDIWNETCLLLDCLNIFAINIKPMSNSNLTVLISQMFNRQLTNTHRTTMKPKANNKHI